MAEVIPFRGIRYNPAKIKNPADVTTPPYDVIPPAQQEAFYAAHPHNIIRLILGKTSEKDTETDNRYTRAAAYYKQWQFEDVLIPDESPVFYLGATDFTVEGQPLTRYGLIARIRIEPFDKGIILPHEKTFSKIKSDRLALMHQCHANFSPVFSLYPDPENILDRLKYAAEQKAPDMDFVDSEGNRQKLWCLDDPALLEYVEKTMKDTPLFIADGHHRYETALAYRDQIAEKDPDFSPDHPANYIMMYLASMEDPGMVILPAHRMLHNVEPERAEQLLSGIGQYFDVFSMPFSPEEQEDVKGQFFSFLKNLQEEPGLTTLGFVMKGRPEFYLLKLRSGVMEDLFGLELPECVRMLDVTVLTRLIFMELLGFDQARLDNEKLISYSSKASEAVNAALNGECDLSFILNPTRIEQVQEVARNREVMPRKSTYFYPKVITGQVINPLK